MPKLEWPEGSEPTLEAVRALHTPAGNYRISPSSYLASTAFSGTTCAGRVYVLSGACSFAFDDTSVDLAARSYFDHPAGNYQFSTKGNDGVSLVHVWLLPPEFRQDDT